MPHKCARAGCAGPGLIYERENRYLCPPHADETRLEMAALAAMGTPAPSPTEQEHHARQVANSHSLADVYPELRDPGILAAHIQLWRELENGKETE